MASLGKKFLSAFVEVNQTDPQKDPPPVKESISAGPTPGATSGATAARTDNRFADYFDKLFREANIPGPDYYEFAAMVVALRSVPDEASRFAAAYAGLRVQGLDKEKLLSTAAEYLKILETDAGLFHTTVDAALQEKVHARKTEAAQKKTRLEDLTKEIASLQEQIKTLEAEVQDNEEKINSRNDAYAIESAERRARIEADMIKIKSHLH